MIKGILYLLAACLCWSLVFVIPDLLSGFSLVEICLGRFFFFGIVSVFLILTKRRDLLEKSYAPVWKKAFLFSFSAAIACYTFTLFCIQYASSATAALLFGTVPIIVAFFGNLKRKEYPFKVFFLPCLMMGIGIVISNKEAFVFQTKILSSYPVGLISGILGVGCWVWYVIVSFDFMEKNKNVSSLDWVIMFGSAVFCQVLLLSVSIFWVTDDLGKYCSFTKDLQYFLLGAFVLGIIGSWMPLYFWTQGNLRLPISLVGQISVFELIFGLVLIFLVQKKIPSFMEISGISLMITGVLLGLHSLKKGASKA